MTSTTGTTRPPRTPSSDPRVTPAMRQHARFKAKYPDCVLFFRMGDFYEMFGDDAVLANKVLGITLTQRTEGVPMAGVPYHAVETYLRRMIEAGYRVAVCDQIQDPREAKGVVDRAVTRVLTPGTLVDETLLDESRPNQVAAIQFLESGERSAAALAVVELSTGSFSLVDLPPERVMDELVRLSPSELLHVETADGATPARIESLRTAVGCALTARPAWTFRLDDARDCLLEHFGVATLAGFGLDDDDPALGAAGAILRYLQETQAPGALDKSDRLGHLCPPKREPADRYLTIDATTLRNLEIECTLRGQTTAGSLLSIFVPGTAVRTAMGKRLLRRWLCFPLRDLVAIRARHKAVAALTRDRPFADALGKPLAAVQDVARIAGRISMNRATPRDVVALGKSVRELGAIANLLDGRLPFAQSHARLLALAGTLAPLGRTIDKQCIDSPPAHLREGGLFRDGIDAELDEARTLQRDAAGWLAAYQQRLVEQTGINTLKIGYNKVFGYYIQITHTHADRVPDTFSRKQTLKNAQRYTTPELKVFEEKVTTAQARAIDREKLLFERLCREAAAPAQALSEYAGIVAELDALACFAHAARRYGYTCPQLTEEPMLDIRQGRHPVLDQTLGERFVPNDCLLGPARPFAPDSTGRSNDHGDPHETPAADGRARRDSPGQASSLKPQASIALITGPNMAGKSTYIRQVALIVLLAHAGSFVPAEAATIGLVDRIFTRIGASDELHAGRSTFMVEMIEAANILHHATDRSLVILDEIGRGTSTLDGLSLAWAITETLAQRRCRTLFATHYHELTALADRVENLRNLHVSVREWGNEIIFVYRIQPGQTGRSYGIHVAKIAGLPSETIDRATQLLETLAVQTEPPNDDDSPPTSGPNSQLGLFTEYLEHPVVKELGQADLDTMTPIKAFDLLRRLHKQVQAGPRPPAPSSG
ncbi:MAG: DNA mismatch repair protein MutS [Planctomycetota bacterium]|nr:DNA mismatch repair protein MutS [Planctomycetota bacterium]